MGFRNQQSMNASNVESDLKMEMYEKVERTIQKGSLQTAMELWSAGSFSEDHFDGKNGLYRLAASIPLKPTLSPREVLEESHVLRGKLSELTVKPSRMFIHASMYEIEWEARGHQVVRSKAQYMELILHFALFLERNQFDYFNMNLQIGFLLDTPGESIGDIPMNEVNFSPIFNRECFGWDGYIQVLCTKIF